MTIQSVDHVTEGLSRFTSRLEHEELKSFVEVFLLRYQALEADFITLANFKSIDLAENIWLDYIGKLLNTPRNSETDEDYRVILRSRIASASSNGTPNSVTSLVKEFTNAVKVSYRECGMAYATLVVNGKSNIGSRLYSLVEEVKPAGVNLVLQSDFNNNAFYPVYELNLEVEENFQTTGDGTNLENFQITFDGIDLVNFTTAEQGEELYNRSVIGDQNYLYYEEGSVFQLTNDGSVYEDMTTTSDGSTQDFFKVVDPYTDIYIPANIRPLVWEVTETSEDMT